MVLSHVTALVTGAASGLGQATALRFLQQVGLFSTWLPLSSFPRYMLCTHDTWIPLTPYGSSVKLEGKLTPTYHDTKKGARVVLADLPATEPAALASLQELDQDMRARGVFAGVDVCVGPVKVCCERAYVVPLSPALSMPLLCGYPQPNHLPILFVILLPPHLLISSILSH